MSLRVWLAPVLTSKLWSNLTYSTACPKASVPSVIWLTLALTNSHPAGLAAAPRRKPKGKPRPQEDVVYNQAFSQRRIIVEHTIGRMRRYEAITQMDRHHRQDHTPRVVAIAGLVNRQIAHRFPGLVA